MYIISLKAVLFFTYISGEEPYSDKTLYALKAFGTFKWLLICYKTSWCYICCYKTSWCYICCYNTSWCYICCYNTSWCVTFAVIILVGVLHLLL